ncbi:hypothetical protein SBY92_000198 [Candida maltosa Xu316]
MAIFISSTNVPIGYTVPKFPSLFWPIGANRSSYLNSFLYFSWDIWRFTVFWSMLLSGGLYAIVGLMAASSSFMNKYRHKLKFGPSESMSCVFIMVFYIFAGLLKGFVGGAIVGVILAAIYQAGSLTMSTWIPLTWAIAQLLYDIISSYSTSSTIL